MGVHFANGTLFDNRVDVEHPEVLVYEPRNGKLHLVAVEYIAPAPAWRRRTRTYDKPELMGQLFHYAPGPNRYERSRSTSCTCGRGKENPHGPFADWNPSVSCALWGGAQG